MEACVRVSLASPEEAKIIRRAMSVDKKPGSRSSVGISVEGNDLILNIGARDPGALRAALNSSLREVKIGSAVFQQFSKSK